MAETNDKSQDKKRPQGEAEEADGYRPSSRVRDKAKEPPPEKEAPKQQLSSYEAFMEQHWESWLRPVLVLVLLAGGYLAYKFEALHESMAGLVVAGGVIAVTLYSTAVPAIEMIKTKNRQLLFGLVVAVWAFAAGYPTLRKAVPRPVLGEVTLTESNKSAKVNAGSNTGPYDLTVTGKLRQSGGQNQTASYELTVTGSGGTSETVEDSLEYAVHQTRGRRGATSTWVESHDEKVHRLPASIHGPEVTISTDKVDDLLENGLQVMVNPQGLNPWLFWALGIVVLLIMMGVEATVGDANDKTHLVMASAFTLGFSARFYYLATSSNLLRPAVDALFVAAIGGGIGGTFVGWMVRKISKRDKLRPAKRREKDQED